MSWDDRELQDALDRYEALCRANRMTKKSVHSYWDYARRFLTWRTGEYAPRGMRSGKRQVPIGRASVADLKQQANDYGRFLDAAGLSQPAVDTYFRHAMFFVRWLAGEFVPGRRTRA